MYLYEKNCMILNLKIYWNFKIMEPFFTMIKSWNSWEYFLMFYYDKIIKYTRNVSNVFWIRFGIFKYSSRRLYQYNASYFTVEVLIRTSCFKITSLWVKKENFSLFTYLCGSISSEIESHPHYVDIYNEDCIWEYFL